MNLELLTYITKTYKYNLVLLNFILLSNKKNDRIKKQSSESMLGTPLPEDAEVPFISSLQGTKARSMSLHNKSSALESFMKFDKKYTRVSSFESDEYTLVSILNGIRLYILCHYNSSSFQQRRHSEQKENDITETEDEESVLLTEDADPDSEPHNPLKIVSALEEKITPSSSRKGILDM